MMEPTIQDIPDAPPAVYLTDWYRLTLNTIFWNQYFSTTFHYHLLAFLLLLVGWLGGLSGMFPGYFIIVWFSLMAFALSMFFYSSIALFRYYRVLKSPENQVQYLVRRLEQTDSGIVFRFEIDQPSLLEWNQISAIHLNVTHLRLQINNGKDTIIIPCTAFATPEAYNKFRNLLDEHNLSPRRKR